MLDLNSPIWDSLASAGGGTGALAAKILREVRRGNERDYPELFEQLCHQFSIGVVAYPAVPHLVDIARTVNRDHRVWPLMIVGGIESARLTNSISSPEIPKEWKSEYSAAGEEALKLAAECLTHRQWLTWESRAIIATVSALQGHGNLSMHLFLQGGSDEISCPVCGEYIDFTEKENGSMQAG